MANAHSGNTIGSVRDCDPRINDIRSHDQEEKSHAANDEDGGRQDSTTMRHHRSMWCCGASQQATSRQDATHRSGAFSRWNRQFAMPSWMHPRADQEHMGTFSSRANKDLRDACRGQRWNHKQL